MPDVLAEATVVVNGQIDPSIGRDVTRAFDSVDDALDDAAAAFQRLDREIQNARQVSTRAFGELNESSNLARDGFGDLSTAASAVGAGLAATGVISEDSVTRFTAVADTLGGVEGAFTAVKGASALAGSAFTALSGTLTKIPGVTRAVTIAQAALNAVMSANPIALTVLALAALTAAFVIAYKKSETFRNIVNAAFNGVKAAASVAFGFISKVATTAFNVILGAGKALKSFLGTIWSGVASAAKTAFNGLLTVLRPIAAVINKVIAGANKVSGAFGGPQIPQIPKFANGVRNFRGGFAEVGERGPEIVYLPPGSDVYSNSESQRMRGTGITQNNTYIFQGPESFAGARRDADWSAKHGTRFGNATRAVMPA